MPKAINKNMDKENKEREKDVFVKPKLTHVLKLIKDSWKEYKVKFTGYAKIYLQALKDKVLLILVGIFLFFVLISVLVSFLVPGLAASIVGVLVALSGSALVVYGVFYIFARVQIAFCLACAEKEIDSKKLFIDSKKYFWIYIWLSFLAGILLFILYLSIYLFVYIMAFSLYSELLIALTFSVFFIVSFVIFILFQIFFNPAVYAFIFEDYNGLPAFRRGYELIRRYWWPVFGRLALFGLALFILEILDSFLGDSYNIISMIIILFILPLFFIYNYKIFKELKEFKGESSVIKKNVRDKFWVLILLFIIIIWVAIFFFLGFV